METAEEVLKTLQGYIDEYEYIIENEKVGVRIKDTYLFLIQTLKGIIKEHSTKL